MNEAITAAKISAEQIAKATKPLKDIRIDVVDTQLNGIKGAMNALKMSNKLVDTANSSFTGNKLLTVLSNLNVCFIYNLTIPF